MLMNLRSVVVGLAVLFAATAASEEPKRDPHTQLEFFIGTWTIAGEESYREMCRWAPGKRAVICETSGGFSIFGFSAHQNAYTHYALSREGVLETLYGWVTEKQWDFVGQTENAGEYKRVKVTLTPTKAGFTFRQDVSINGGSWTKEHDFEYVRLSSATEASK